jgi:hypothetical protein
MRSEFKALTKNQQKKLENNAKKIVYVNHMKPYIQKLKNKPIGTHIKYTPISQNDMNKQTRMVVKILLNNQVRIK